MTKKELEQKIRRQAGNLIYCWLYNDDAKYLGSKATILLNKRDIQIKYIRGLVYATPELGGKEDLVYEWIKDEIRNTYAPIQNPSTKKYEPATPRLIIAALMQGKSVKGKNWKEGVYGRIGDTGTESYSLEALRSGNVDLLDVQGRSVGNEVSITYPNYVLDWNEYQPASLTMVSKDGTTANTFTYDGGTGTYKLATLSDPEEVVDAGTGNKIDWTSQELWNNVSNACTQIAGLISQFATALSGITGPQALMPAQVSDGWVEPVTEKKSGVLTSGTGLLLGGALVASAFVMNKKK